MTETLNSQSLIRQAVQREGEYDWSGATELYRQCLHILSITDPAEKGEIHEKLGYALFRMAMQAERTEEFTSHVREAIAGYQRARELYEEKGDLSAKARALRCSAMASYLGFWLSADPKEKKRVVDEAWELAKQTLQAFEEAKEPGDYARTYNDLSTCASLSYLLEWSVEHRETILREAIQHGERAIQLLSSIGDHVELARSYTRTAIYLSWLGLYFIAQGEKKQYSEKAKSYFSNGKEHSERTALLELVSTSHDEDAHALLGLTAGSAESINQFEKALRFAEATKDNLLIGSGLDWLSYHSAWRILGTEDPDERRKLRQRALESAESAKRHYHPISFTSPRGLAFG